MTTTYGTISTEPPSSDVPFISQARERIRSRIGTRRPWREMLSFSIPENLGTALQRLYTNASHFHVNYAIIVLFMIFLSLLWHPVSLIVFLVTMVAWLFLYFLRDDPIMVFGYAVEEKVILVVLSIFTVTLLLLKHAFVFLGGLAVGLVVVMVHGGLGKASDSVLDEEQGGARVDLRETASASFSSPY